MLQGVIKIIINKNIYIIPYLNVGVLTHCAVACENSIATVEARQWTQTDHVNIETKVMPIDDFIDAFTAMLNT